MNKRNMRSFALGILISVCLIGIFYFSEEKSITQVNMDEKEAKSFLENKGYVILTKEQYNKLESTIADAKENAKKSKTEQETKHEEIDETSMNTTIKLEIISGMVSHDIAALLEKNKIIDDAGQFEMYLEENGYSKRIQLGVFELKAGMSFKEIAKMITKS